MSDTHPGVEDEVEHALRLGLATAAQLADRFARARQELTRDAQRRSDDAHQQLEGRFRAEGASAAARLSVIERPEWWNHASPQQIVSMYELAQQWRNDQSRAANTFDTIAQQVQDRYGIDVTRPDPDADELRAALAQVEINRATANDPAADVERPDDLAAAVAAVVRADQRDAALRDAALGALAELAVGSDKSAKLIVADGRAVEGLDQSGPAYDTHQRRDATTARMRENGVPEDSVAVAMRADIAQARPATGAVATPTPAPQRTSGRSVDRGGFQPDRAR